MNRIEYINILKQRLHTLPYDEISSAIAYYEEYFDEAGPENEANVISELGDPAAVAAQIIAKYAVYGSQSDTTAGTPPKKKDLSSLWAIILAVFAAPIAFPVAIAVAAVAFALIVVVCAVVFSFLITGIALAVSGIILFIVAFPTIIADIGAGIFALGSGLFILGMGMAICKWCISLSKVTFSEIAKLIGKIILRRGNHEKA